jgi:hypothetical protein
VSDTAPQHEQWLYRLGLATAPIAFVPTPTPGGDAANTAHYHAEPGFSEITIEYDPAADELNVSVVHELLHAATRHVGAAIGAQDGMVAAWLKAAYEEDIEALARALVRAWA